MSEIDRTPKKPNSPPDPVIISWSGLKRWENCRQHQLRVITKETEKAEKGRIFLPGTVCDLVQRRWLDSGDPQPGQMVDLVEEVFKDVVSEGESKIHWKGDPKKDMAEVQDFCRTTVSRLEPWLLQNVTPFRYQAEWRFRAHMEVPYICGEGARAPVKMIGGADIIVQDDADKFHIYDLKITKTMDYIRSTLAQLIFYDIAWGVIQGDFGMTSKWGFITPALEERFVPIEIAHHDRQVMMSRIVKYAQGVWTDQWEPKSDDKGCNWCEARKVCEKFKTILTVEENGKQKMSFANAAAQRAKFRKPDETLS